VLAIGEILIILWLVIRGARAAPMKANHASSERHPA
jgi:hypothetical protein